MTFDSFFWLTVGLFIGSTLTFIVILATDKEIKDV